MKHIEYSNKFDSCVSLSKCVYNKDDCGKLKSKYSNHTRRSKQNTYHVMNKNIAPSKVTDRQEERGDAFRGIPKLWLLGVLRLSWGDMDIAKRRLLPLLVP